MFWEMQHSVLDIVYDVNIFVSFVAVHLSKTCVINL